MSQVPVYLIIIIISLANQTEQSKWIEERRRCCRSIYILKYYNIYSSDIVIYFHIIYITQSSSLAVLFRISFCVQSKEIISQHAITKNALHSTTRSLNSCFRLRCYYMRRANMYNIIIFFIRTMEFRKSTRTYLLLM